MGISVWSTWFFGPAFRAALGRFTLIAAIAFFLVHLGLFALKPWIPQLEPNPLLRVQLTRCTRRFGTAFL